MRYVKLTGIVEEIIQRYPNIDIAEFLQDKLQLPLYKAEVLADRIEKQYCQKVTKETEQTSVRQLLEKSSKPEPSPRASAFSVEHLSEKEFGGFIKWLFEELGYEAQLGKREAGLGVDLVATRVGEKTAVLAVKCPKSYEVSSLIVSIAQEAKRINGYDKAIVLATAYFTPQTAEDAQKAEVELWDIDTLTQKILEVKQKVEQKVQAHFPEYNGSLLLSLQRLGDTKDFLIEPKAGEKYDVYLPGVKYPLLTFQVQSGDVARCVFRIKYNEPVGESDGQVLISSDDSGRLGPDGAEAYALIIQYLEQFLE